MPDQAGGIWVHGSTMTFGGVSVDGLRTITVPGGAKGQVDVTSHSSGGRERTVPGLKSAPTVDLEILLLPGDVGQAAMIANHEAQGANIVEIVITLPDSVLDAGYDQLSWTYGGYVLDVTPANLPHDNNPATRSFTISVESDVAEAVVASPES